MTEIRDLIGQHFLLPLGKIFGKPKDIAGALERHLPEGSGETELEELASKIIETRKAKGWPSLPELISALGTLGAKKPIAPRSGSRLQNEAAAWAEAEWRAVQFLRKDPLTERAIRERWAPALLEFATKHGRSPGWDEEAPLIAKSRKNDVDARDLTGPYGAALRTLRDGMHEATARRLTGKTEAA